MLFKNNLYIRVIVALCISNILFIVLTAFLYFNPDDTQAIEVNKPKTKIMVQLAGEVVNPNVYELDSDKRLNDLIHLAGGFTEDADLNSVNLAILLNDQMKITIPSKKTNVDTSTEQVNYSNKININTATLEELDRLTGIGPSKAAEIIKYREKYGNFSETKQIMRVTGIGEKTYEQIKDDICV